MGLLVDNAEVDFIRRAEGIFGIVFILSRSGILKELQRLTATAQEGKAIDEFIKQHHQQ